ncbi:4-hydroxy-tetrahydrodipicolinate reductase [Anaerotignum neopropionicum]|uniref:4-hydroxy-tetrahydrodipicolinate reductase n=1 Tax=Anaerotignum neopropionicum TaxID=36847 RepID=A0A136WD24_9FIRM|nr:4-hydroxy-tetrahydrodipicolinate reductase [Anaerotignum neopropionicum]KXL52390.1 4-hydroxy-tetrahydrodipicolinate reductase [Anaerotignum neopropionicum]
MINIIIHGCGGKMGQVVAEIVENDTACQVVAGIDPSMSEASFPVFPTPADCTVEADVIIDFSTAMAVPALLEFSKAKKIPVVVCTTALGDETTELMTETSHSVAVLKSANMSLGVNLLLELVQKAAQILHDANFDIEIVEKHHNQKIDAPSGTALALANAINEAMEQQFHYVYDRSQIREKREPKEIGIHAVRGGNIVGDHDVIFAGRDEVIELSHHATSREVFAVGAVKAAKYLAYKGPGLYSMKDVLA